MKRDIWNRCDFCGKFISIDDFEKDKAIREMLTQDTLETQESYITYHKLCRYPERGQS